MPLSINTNLASMTAQRSFLNSNSALETSFERLSTGKRINSAADDAAGLAIGKDLESRVNGLSQAIRNVNDGISMVQITEGTLDEVTTILQRMRDLAVQASNASLSSTERGYLDSEQAKLATTLDSVLDQAKFNSIDLVSTTSNTRKEIHSGADATDTIVMDTKTLSASVLGVTSAIDLANTGGTLESVAFSPTMHKTATNESVALGVTTYATADEVYTLAVGTDNFITGSAVTGTTSSGLAETVTMSSTLHTSGNATYNVAITDGSGNVRTYSSGSIAFTSDAATTAGLIQTALVADTDSSTSQTMLADFGINVTVDAAGTFLLTYNTNANQALAAGNYALTASGSDAGTPTAASISQEGKTAAEATQDDLITKLTAATGSVSTKTLAQLGITVSETSPGGGITLTYDQSGFTSTNQSQATYSLTSSNVVATPAVITDGSSGSDTYSVTIGNSTYSTGSVAFNTNAATTAADIQTALRAATDSTTGQTMLQDLGITATVTDGSIVLTYADKENVAESSYTLAVGGTGAAVTAAASITDGSNKARDAITTVDSALAIVASERAKLGATQAQLESTVRNLANVAENTAAAQGRIMDTDYAAETANLTKAQILQQAATSILAQANAQPQAVLSLLQ